MTIYPIRFLSEFKNFYRISLNNLKNLALKKQDNTYRSSSHLIVSFFVKKMENINQELTREVQLSKLNIVKLADSDFLEKQQDFQILSRYLTQCSQSNYNRYFKGKNWEKRIIFIGKMKIIRFIRILYWLSRWEILSMKGLLSLFK